MSSAKRSQSGGAPAAAPSASTLPPAQELLVLQHQLRHAKVRLRERTAVVEELTQANQENVQALKQQRKFSQRLEEVWSELENSLRAMVPAMPSALPAPALHASASDAAHSRSAYTNPVLNMLAARWSELSGQSIESMKAASAASAKAALKQHRHAADGDAAMNGDDEDEAEVGDEDDDEEEQNGNADDALEQQLQHNLHQRAAFTQSLLTTLLHAMPKPAPAPDAARLALLQSDNLSLQQRLHSTHNDLLLLQATLADREKKLEALEDQQAATQRRYVRLTQDVEDGRVSSAKAAAAAKTEQAAAASVAAEAPAAAVKTEADGDVLMDGKTDVKLEGHLAAAFTAASARAAALPDTRALTAEERAETAVETKPVLLTPLQIVQLSDECAEFKLLAETRATQVRQLQKEKSIVEQSVLKARMDFLDNTALICTSKEYIRAAALTEKHRVMRESAVKLASDSKQQVADAEANLERVKAEHERQVQAAGEVFDRVSNEHQAIISQLQTENLQLQNQLIELKQTASAMNDVPFFTQLRSTILPDLERRLKEQATVAAQAKAEREAQAKLGAGPDRAAMFAKAMRIWKEAELTLRAEKKALEEQLAAAATPSAAAAASASSASASSSLRTRVASLEHENATLKQQLNDLRTAGPQAALQEELDMTKELSETLGGELDSLTKEIEDVRAQATKLASFQVDAQKALDRSRQEKTNMLKQQTLLKVESSKLQQMHGATVESIQKHSALAKASQAETARMQQEVAAAKEEVAQAQRAVEWMRAQEMKAAGDNAEFKTKFLQLTNIHGHCEDAIKGLRKKEMEAATVSGQLVERIVTLKAKLQLKNPAGGKPSKTAAAAATTGMTNDQARIHQMELLLNCQVCNLRQKDKLIVKCMHAFCGQCVQANLDSRLRKCPQCGLKFGDGDVKTLFL